MLNLSTYIFKFLKKVRGKSLVNSKIHSTSKVEAGSELLNVTMERHSFCGYNCSINNCIIGSFTSIANNVIIGDGMHPMSWVSTSPVFYSGSDSVKTKFSEHHRVSPIYTHIGHDVWIGRNVLIKQGVTIGSGAVIGMGSVVTKDVSPYSVVAGVPAKEIRKRFSEEIINKLLSIQWWNLSDNDLKKWAVYFKSPDRFINQYYL